MRYIISLLTFYCDPSRTFWPKARKGNSRNKKSSQWHVEKDCKGTLNQNEWEDPRSMLLIKV